MWTPQAVIREGLERFSAQGMPAFQEALVGLVGHSLQTPLLEPRAGG